MPGNSSNYWSSMDFGSEEDDSTPSKTPSTRVYVDPWDLENYAFMRRHLGDTSEASNPPSPEREPTSSSFYYIPADQEYRQEMRRNSMQRTVLHDSPAAFAGIDEVDFHNDNFEMPSDQGIYYHQPYEDYNHERKLLVPRPTFTSDTGSSLSSGNENYVYTTTVPCEPGSADPSLVYVYETANRKRKITLPKNSKNHSRPSLQTRPAPVRKFRRIRNINCPDCRMLESAGYLSQGDLSLSTLSSISPVLKTPPENFGLSQYGHLKIDYSCSWHSLDQLMANDNEDKFSTSKYS